MCTDPLQSRSYPPSSWYLFDPQEQPRGNCHLCPAATFAFHSLTCQHVFPRAEDQHMRSGMHDTRTLRTLCFASPPAGVLHVAHGHPAALATQHAQQATMPSGCNAAPGIHRTAPPPPRPTPLRHSVYSCACAICMGRTHAVGTRHAHTATSKHAASPERIILESRCKQEVHTSKRVASKSQTKTRRCALRTCQPMP